MGFIDSLKSLFGKKVMDSSKPGSFPGAWFTANAETGQIVNEWTALKQATVLQCVTVISNGISQIPFRLMGPEHKEADNHDLFYLFREKPNKWQSAYDFWNLVGFHLALQGEIVIWKITVRGKIQQLIPFPPQRFIVNETYRGGWAVNEYTLIKDDSSTVIVPEDDVWHLRWREYDIRVGLPQLAIVQSVVGTAISSDKLSASMMNTGSRYSGMLTATQSLSPEQRKQIQEEWQKMYGGPENAFKTIVLGADLKFQSINQTNEDAQFIEQKQLQIEEICRCWNVNPQLVFFYNKNQSYGNTEQMMVQHVVYTMAPWYRMIEESAYVNLLTEEERRRDGLYFAFNDTALLRTDASKRAEFYKKLFNIGSITPNEIRALEDMPPMDGGDKLYIQGAVVPLEDAGKWQAGKNAAASADDTESDKDNEVTDDATSTGI